MQKIKSSELILASLGDQTRAFALILEELPMGAFLAGEDGTVVSINTQGLGLLRLLNIKLYRKKLPNFHPASEKFVWTGSPTESNKTPIFTGYPITLDETIYYCLIINSETDPKSGWFNEHVLRNLIDHSNDGIVIFDHNLKFVEWNKGIEKITGYSAGEVSGMTMGEFLKLVSLRPEKPIRDKDILKGSYRSLMKRMLEMMSFNEIEVEIRKKDGQLGVAEYRMFPAFINGRIFSGAIVRDITEHKKAEETLHASEARFRTLVEAMGEGAFTLDLDLNILFSNPAAESMYGVEPGFFIGKNLRDIIDRRYTSFLDRQISRIKSGLSSRYEIEVADFRGNAHAVKVTSSPWRNANREIMGSIVVFSDITEWKLAEERLHFTSSHDEVTSLYNRNFYEEEKKRLQAGRRWPITAVIIDLDEFKAVNDTLGHTAGDLLLREFGRIIRQVFRAEDLVARIGGDEFAILLPETEKSTAKEAVERLQNAVSKHNENSPDQKIYFSVGTGTAKTSEELEDAIRRADTRMYREKKQKKHTNCQD